jgi:hypothetical protein
MRFPDVSTLPGAYATLQTPVVPPVEPPLEPLEVPPPLVVDGLPEPEQSVSQVPNRSTRTIFGHSTAGKRITWRVR